MMNQKKKKTKLKLHVEYDSCETDSYDGNSYYSFKLTRATNKVPKNWSTFSQVLEVDEPPEYIRVLFVRYSSGNTFNNTYGEGAVAGIYLTKEEASKAKQSIEDGTWKECAPWEGYFESIESVETQIMEVEYA